VVRVHVLNFNYIHNLKQIKLNNVSVIWNFSYEHNIFVIAFSPILLNNDYLQIHRRAVRTNGSNININVCKTLMRILIYLSVE
jgi:hypothetical protein